MPGIASLQALQYYAHPRNAFWAIMAELFGIDPTASYSQRVAELSRHPLILWDTLQACHRPGSLDSNIDAKTARANDFPGLLKRFPEIRAILFNGATAERYFKQLVLPNLPEKLELTLLRMPSTSPAHAGMDFEQKLSAWRQLLDFID
jgi:hypoxanthine-DNA glycosylase